MAQPAAAETPAPAAQQADGTKAAAPPKPEAAPEPESSHAQPAQAAKPAATPTAKDNGGASAATAEELRRAKSSPLVRKIAQEHGVDIANLEGTGLSGRVTKNDILSFIESGAPVASPSTSVGAPSRQTPTVAPPTLKPAEGDRIEQMSVMRKKIAEHMVSSRRTSAHVTTVYEIDMTRNRQDSREEQGRVFRTHRHEAHLHAVYFPGGE